MKVLIMIAQSVFVENYVKDCEVSKPIRSCRAITSLNNENIVENDHIEQETIENHFVATNKNLDKYPTLK